MEESDKEQLLNYISKQNEIVNDLLELIGCTLLDKRIPPDITLLAEEKLKQVAVKHTKLMEQFKDI